MELILHDSYHFNRKHYIQDYIGKRFGKLVVLGKVDKTNREIIWKCKCDCGNETNIRVNHLFSMGVTSCGCNNFTHKLTLHPLYNVWCNMHRRCTDPKGSHWHNYGGRGITVCEEWSDMVTFYDWAIAAGYKHGLQLDRENNNKGYNPTNCRFVTSEVNARNKRKYKNNRSGYKCIGACSSGWRVRINGVLLGSNFKSKLSALITLNNYIVTNKLNNEVQKYYGE